MPAASRLFLMLPLVAGAVAQQPALKDVHRVMPAYRPYGDRHAVGDVTGDGIEDIVFIAENFLGTVWRSSPDGVYTIDPLAAPQHDEECVAMLLVDVDGDADLDCVTVNTGPFTGGADIVYFNDGTGRFPFTSLLPGSDYQSACVDAADIDGDGDQDLVVGCRVDGLAFGPEDRVYVNDGNGGFTMENSRLPPNHDHTNTVAFLDLDGDGDQDLFFGDRAYFTVSYRLYANDGSGHFAAVPLPGATFAPEVVEAVAEDFDNDGDTDLLLSEVSGYAWPTQLRYLDNDGSGGLLASSAPTPGAGIAQFLIGDWNADGRTDYAVRRREHLFPNTADTVYPYTRGAAGGFQPAQLPPAQVGNRNSIALDYDLDGDSDLVAPSAHLFVWLDCALLRNIGTAWVPLPSTTLPPHAYYHRLGDINGDGHLDLVIAPNSLYGARILVGSGAGTFAEIPPGDFGLGPSTAAGSAAALGDVDGDDDVDICLPGNLVRLFLNQGGTFHAAPFPPVGAGYAALADLDGDDDLDVVLATTSSSSANRVMLNDGSGTFHELPNALPSVPWLALNLADFNGDGRLDIATYGVIHGNPTGAGILMNLGNATFAALPVPGLFPGTTIVADFDVDGDVDLFVAGTWVAATAEHHVFLNDGTGAFSVQTVPAAGNTSLRRVIGADLDADGFVDIVEASCGPTCDGVPPRILHNTGGSFVPVANADLDWPYEILETGVADIDEDGDPDVLVVSQQGTFLYRSLHHQLAWRSLPRTGYPLRLHLFGRANEPYLLAAALLPADLPIAGLGRLRLDPGSLEVLVCAAYDPNGRAEFTAPVPNLPGLLGLSLYWQALSLSPPRLGNLEVTTLQAH